MEPFPFHGARAICTPTNDPIEGYPYIYGVRHCDDSDEPATVEPRVWVNRHGYLHTNRPLLFPDNEDQFLNIPRGVAHNFYY